MKEQQFVCDMNCAFFLRKKCEIVVERNDPDKNRKHNPANVQIEKAPEVKQTKERKLGQPEFPQNSLSSF